MSQMDHDLYVGTDTEREYLLRIWIDGTHELATRPDPGATWGPPVVLTRQSSEVS